MTTSDVQLETGSSRKQENIRVVVRCRPMSKSELISHTNIVEIDNTTGSITLLNTKSSGERKREFTFDSVYDWNSKQFDVYLETIHPIVESVLQGYNGTIFAYGQTGTGKTYTMQGESNEPEKRGVIPNCFDFIFSHISKTENLQFLVRASYMEIYQDEVKDLLSKDQEKRLQLRERTDTGKIISVFL
ncbi:Kif3b protein [Oopsacas minuta]|uniref:Kif3b protein n=1 Tax=Oopsacas minuta TaxID=111878 RepID=A0AAV7K0L4_9METZ|nr:Kif3b protein [Oopsacas minuta]